jgi:hypothetical protein
MTRQQHVRAIARLVVERVEGRSPRQARRIAHPGLAAALGTRGLIEDARTRHLGTLDADEGLVALCIPWEEVLAETAEQLARPAVSCERCGARLPRRRRVCSRCRRRQNG